MRFAWMVPALMLGLSAPMLVTDTRLEVSEPSQPAQDAPAPEPQPELKALLEDARSLINQRKWGEALQKADALFQQATEKGDRIGTAYAHHLKAQGLRAQGKVAEALGHWEQAQKLWDALGEGALVVEAQLGQAQCLLRNEPERAQRLVEEAVSRAEAESHRPRAAGRILVRFCREVAAASPALAQRAGEAALALLSRHTPQSEEQASALSALGVVFYYQGNMEQAQAYLEQALKIAESVNPSSVEAASALNSLGVIFFARGDLDRAQTYYERALAIREQHDPSSQDIANTLNNLGNVCARRGDLVQAQAYYERALKIYQQIQPDSWNVANTLNSLGVLFYERNELTQAQEYFEQSLKIHEKLDSRSRDTAKALNNLGAVFYARGDFEQAQVYYERALAIRQHILPNSTETANTLLGIGLVWYARGNLEKAQSYYEQALALYEQVVPRSHEIAHALYNLGSVCREQGNLLQAQVYYERALEIYKRFADSQAIANTLNDLGNIFAEKGDFVRAQEYYEQSLQIAEQLDPASRQTANALNNLGNVFAERGDLVQAQACFERALTINMKINPNSRQTANTLNNLGIICYYRGNLDQAQAYYERALRIREQSHPYSHDTANTLDNLGNVFYTRGDFAQAQHCYERALQIRETYRRSIVDADERSRFGEKYFTTYANLAAASLRQNHLAQAAEALERARARELTDALYKRQLQLPNAPQALQKLLQQQQALEAERYALHNKLRQSDPSDKEALRALNERLFDLTNQQDKIDARIRNEFPQYAQLLAPTPPRIQTIQQGLDNGVVMLYYALLPKELLIVAVSRQQVQGYRVPVKQEQLENAVQEFRRIISRPPLMRTASERRTLVRLGRQLYDWLVKPAAASLQGAKRVALCPEGVLNLLPWGALIVSTDKNGKPTYWVERMALHLTPSAGVYRQARGVKPASGGVMVAAVSEYGGFQQASAREVEALLRRSGTTLSNLPNVKAEVGRIQQVFRKGVRVAQEQAATPERVRVLAQGARVVHFSCHARADNADPYGSALLLAPAGRDEGLLEAAEVLGSWRLAADIVMLSACETGVGVLRRYEGMYGLARAFLFAGSRSVGASLWAVSDASTAALMGAFYGQYVKGVPKDEALRLAQLGLLRSKQYSDPYYWSAFVLIGDYR
ncbi:MAG: hypothetical protein KatS3mg021_0424 [Fimbriimonadales bacterium]|jgi:CHAT domain-containing protein/Tfp pilus assembly protein PilF|nr:MAG: hypothetical protein KatS3mg021_0424 [Fimbriimonadales bacterium]